MKLDPNLQELENTQLVRRLADPDPAYVFKHVLVQEVAYGSLLRQERKRLHRAVGLALEALFSDRGEEIAPVLARHFLEADERAKAFRYFVEAGDTAARLFAHEEAISHYRNARELSLEPAADSDQVIHVYLRLGREHELVGDYGQAIACYQQLLDRSQATGDTRLELNALLASATLHSTPTPYLDLEKAEGTTRRALAIAQSLGDQVAEAKILWQRMLMLGFGDNTELAIQLGEQSIALARSLGLTEQLAFALNDITSIYASAGRIEDALQAGEEARRLWVQLENLPMLTDVLSNTTLIRALGGEIDEAIALSEEAHSISVRIGNHWGRSFSRMFIGMFHFDRGEVGRAMAVMDESLEYAERSGFSAPLTIVRGQLGLVHATLGDFNEGIRLAQLARQSAAGGRAFLWAPNVFMAGIHALAGDPGEGARLLEEVARETGETDSTWSLIVLPIPLVRARLDLALGRLAECAETAGALEAQLAAARVVAFRSDALHLQGQALAASGQVEGAQESLSRALAIADRLHLHRLLWEIHLDLASLGTLTPAEKKPHLAAARQSAQYIADHIDVEALRHSFLSLLRVRQAMGQA